MAFKTYITKAGWTRLLNSGLLNSITTFKAGDESIIYGIEDSGVKQSFFDIPITGNREGTTTIPMCSFSERTPIPVKPPRSEDINALNSRIKVAFISEDCTVPFEKNNLTVRVNIDKWIDNLSTLKSTPYSRTASGIKIDIWDYIVGYLEEYNAGTNVWSLKETYKSNIDISYNLLSSEDLEKYKKVNPKFMELTSSGKKMFYNGQTKSRFPSNMILAFNTNVLDGIDVFGTSSTLGMYPDSWGYLADNSYIKSGDLENIIKNNPNAWKTIYPAIIIDETVYTLKTNDSFETKDGVGWYVYGYKDSKGNLAIDAMIEKLKLFMKANGEEVDTGVYRFVINFSVGLKSDKRFNKAYQSKKIGGELKYELYYDTNTINTDLINIT